MNAEGIALVVRASRERFAVSLELDAHLSDVRITLKYIFVDSSHAALS